MTETTSSLEPRTEPPSAEPPHLSDVLLNLIVAFLAPMFLSVSGGSLDHARLAAAHTVNAYRVRTQSDLIAVAQIVAFGLSALGSLSLAMADDLPVSMIVRLRNSANACSRSAEQIRRTLNLGRTMDPAAVDQANLEIDEAEVIASVAAAQTASAEAVKRFQVNQTPVPPPAPSPTLPAKPPAAEAAHAPAAQDILDQQYQTQWAAACANIAAEFTADLPNLPPQERRAAKIKAAMLSKCANDLLNGPPLPHLKPGDLAAFMQRTGG